MVGLNSRFVVLLFTVTIPSRGFVASNAEEPVTLTATFDRMAVVYGDIEALRTEMGKPKRNHLNMRATNASRHDVYFQGLALYALADRLCFEITGDSQALERANPDRDIEAVDVWEIVDAAATKIRRVRQHLSVTDDIARSPRAAVTLDDLFLWINEECRQLNLLLDRPFAPVDVYQQLTTAMAYTTALRARFPGQRIPKTPEYVRGKTPRDVYVMLLECHGIVQDVGEILGITTLSLSVASEDLAEIGPGDVYGLASLLVAEVSYLYHLSGTGTSVRMAYYPGLTFPSHVYQRARLLNVQLDEFISLLREKSTSVKDVAR